MATKSPTFDETVNWATTETQRLGNKNGDMSLGILILVGVVVFIIIFLIITLAGDKEEPSTLDYLNDDDYTMESYIEEIYEPDTGDVSYTEEIIEE